MLVFKRLRNFYSRIYSSFLLALPIHFFPHCLLSRFDCVPGQAQSLYLSTHSTGRTPYLAAGPGFLPCLLKHPLLFFSFMRLFSPLSCATLLLSLWGTVGTVQAQSGVGIGTLTPDASAALDVNSSSKGVLFPRVALTGLYDATTVPTPANGLVVFNTTTTVGNRAQLVSNTGTPNAPAWAPIGAGNNWGVTGNTGLSAATSFLGTVDGTPLSFRVNNRQVAQFQVNGAAWLEATGSANLFVGVQSGQVNTSGLGNVFLGYQTGSLNTTGTANLFVGSYAGLNNTTGSNNQYMGYQAGTRSTTGSQNLFVGALAGYYNTSGGGNVFLGNSTGLNNTTGNFNIFVGGASGYYNTTGASNTFMGCYAGFYNTGGNQNLAVGTQAGYFNTSGSNNLSLGYSAGQTNTSGSGNLSIGAYAGFSSTTASSNQFMGYQAGYATTTGGSNQFSGYRAGYGNTTGTQNYFNGYEAGYSNTTATGNHFEGYQAGRSNTTGNQNQFIGTRAGFYTGTGTTNQFIGTNAGYNNTSGSLNLIVGNDAGYYASTGQNNEFLGFQAGYHTSTGNDNLVVGSSAGYNNSSGSGNLFLGTRADLVNPDMQHDHATAIGYNARVDADYALVLGGTGAYAVKVGVGVTAPSEALQVQGNILTSGTITQSSDLRLKQNVRTLSGALSSVEKLRGVRYTFLPGKGPEGEQVGVIAQEIEPVYPELVRTDKVTGLKSVNYAQLTPVLLEAIKELQAQVRTQAAAQASLYAGLEDMRRQLARLQAATTAPTSANARK